MGSYELIQGIGSHAENILQSAFQAAGTAAGAASGTVVGGGLTPAGITLGVIGGSMGNELGVTAGSATNQIIHSTMKSLADWAEGPSAVSRSAESFPSDAGVGQMDNSIKPIAETEQICDADFFDLSAGTETTIADTDVNLNAEQNQVCDIEYDLYDLPIDF